MNQEIPDNYKDLKVKHEALMGDYLELSSRVERLEELLRSAHASRFSFKSEHLTHPGMLPLFPEEGEEEKDEPKEREVRGHTRTITKKPIPEHLPRVDVHLDVPDHEKTCSSCSEAMSEFKKDISEKLHIKPAELLVKRFIRPAYKCNKCDELRQSKMPAHPIPKAGITVETLAHIAISKYLGGLPLYRQEKIFERSGIQLGRDKMSKWMIRLGEKLDPLKNLLHQELIEDGFLGMDETHFQVLKEENRRPDAKSYMIIQAREGPPGKNISVFHYETSRSKEVVARHLNGFEGSVVTDGLMTYLSYFQSKDEISHGGCWAHGRRRFVEAVKARKSKKGVAKDVLQLIKQLFKIESRIKGKPDEEKLEVRTRESAPLIAEIEELWVANLESIPKKSLTGEGLHYLRNQWDCLTRFLKDPKLPLSNNYVEQKVRPFATGRKSWLFADTVEGANASAVLYSLLVTAKDNGLNPYAYLSKVFTEIDSNEDLRQLLPFS